MIFIENDIEALLINFFERFYPALLNIKGFLQVFITPIVKATKGKQVKAFYTLPEYEQWKASLANPKAWAIKYFKGLGTSTAKEAKEYFGALADHERNFVHSGASDETIAADRKLIDMAFSKKRVEERKDWMNQHEDGTFLDNSVEEVSYPDFINKELVLFSKADLERSIPQVMDGLKPGQRKVLFCAFKRKLKSDIKVAQLAGYVSEHSSYHHGEASLMATIVKLAQDFVGSNNINLFFPSGQFGSRVAGGEDAASPRYIFTRLAPLTRKLFPEVDDALLQYLEDDGQSIEPTFYAPVVPLVLVNGAEGIGTGWSTSIPNFNPRDVIDRVRDFIRDEAAPLDPE